MKPSKNFRELIYFEARKNFLNYWILVFLIALLLLNGWRLGVEYHQKCETFAPYSSAYEELYDQWKGPITAEHIKELMVLYAPLEQKFETQSLSYEKGSGRFTDTENQDFRFLASQFKREMEYDYLYVNTAYQIADQATRISEFTENSNIAQENAKIATSFRNRYIPCFSDTRYLEVWLDHDFSSMLILLLCLFGLSSVFVSERNSQMYMLQRTAKLGGNYTVKAKLFTSFLYVLLVSALFFAEDFLVLQFLSGHWDALWSPVYAIRAMEMTPLSISVWQYILLSGIVKMIAILSLSLIILLLSCVLHDVLTVFFESFGIIVALLLLQIISKTNAYLQLWNPTKVLSVHNLMQKPQYLHCFQITIPMYYVALAGQFILSIFLLVGIYRKNPGRREINVPLRMEKAVIRKEGASPDSFFPSN